MPGRGGIAARVRVARHGAEGEELEIPCHPADAIALALQAAAPIYATGDVLHQSMRAGATTRTGTRRASPTWLERVRPEDFAAPSRGGEPGDA